MKACLLALLLGVTAAQSRGQSRCANLGGIHAGCQICFFTYGPNNSCPVGCDMDFNNTCGGGGGGGAYRFGCKDSPPDACSGKHSDEKSCNADSGCSWCVSKQTHDNPPVSSCVPLANVSGWVKGNACWNTTCTKVP